MIGVPNGRKVGITGLGVHVPDRVLTNAELSTLVDTTDEWIVESDRDPGETYRLG